VKRFGLKLGEVEIPVDENDWSTLRYQWRGFWVPCYHPIINPPQSAILGIAQYSGKTIARDAGPLQLHQYCTCCPCLYHRIIGLGKEL